MRRKWLREAMIRSQIKYWIDRLKIVEYLVAFFEFEHQVLIKMEQEGFWFWL